MFHSPLLCISPAPMVPRPLRANETANISLRPSLPETPAYTVADEQRQIRERERERERERGEREGERERGGEGERERRERTADTIHIGQTSRYNETPEKRYHQRQ